MRLRKKKSPVEIIASVSKWIVIIAVCLIMLAAFVAVCWFLWEVAITFMCVAAVM